MKKKKLYLVKREVWATNIFTAMKNKGSIYEISETDKEKENKKISFKINKK